MGICSVIIKMSYFILEVVGTNRAPEMADRDSMPYTEAVIHETMRISSVGKIYMLVHLFMYLFT